MATKRRIVKGNHYSSKIIDQFLERFDVLTGLSKPAERFALGPLIGSI